MENMKQELNYIEILINSLVKKETILKQIIEKNELQKDLATASKFEYEKFEQLYDEKGKLIAELNLLDSGFESVFERVKDTLVIHKDIYRNEIEKLQMLIRSVTELSMEIEASECRNKELMEKATSSMRGEVKTARAANKAAVDYYNNMAKINVVDPQFMDKKK